jgi:acyl-CoA reductase-like NAD-dependent aldehyde dehydrogenase
MKRNKEALARLVTREIGKPYVETLGEVQEIIDTCDFLTGEGRRLYGQTVPSEMPDKQLFTFRVPVGVASFSTFNEAVELANGHGYGLSAAIYTRDATNALRFRERITAGMLSVNNSTSGAGSHHLPGLALGSGNCIMIYS